MTVLNGAFFIMNESKLLDGAAFRPSEQMFNDKLWDEIK